jgi:hypothetical protein
MRDTRPVDTMQAGLQFTRAFHKFVFRPAMVGREKQCSAVTPTLLVPALLAPRG